MKRLLVFALIFSLVHTSAAFAAGPLLESALRAARQLAQTQVESPKAAEARRIATDLGVGRHVAVKLTSGKTVRGHLHAINDDHFVLLLDQVARPMEIAYGEVEELGPNLSTGQIIGIGVSVAVAVVLIITWLAVRDAAKQIQGTLGP